MDILEPDQERATKIRVMEHLSHKAKHSVSAVQREEEKGWADCVNVYKHLTRRIKVGRARLVSMVPTDKMRQWAQTEVKEHLFKN